MTRLACLDMLGHVILSVAKNPCPGSGESPAKRRILKMHMPKTVAIPPEDTLRPLGKIEVLPNAIHSIAVQAISECYGVVGITAPRLRNGRPVFLPPGQINRGIQMRVIDDQIIIDVYVALEYGLRISEIAHNIMSSVKFSIEKMLGVPVTQVNVNVQGLGNSANTRV
jgi:uncharacterized alkaline shock family protein YloU